MKQWNTLLLCAVSAALLLCTSAQAAERQQKTLQWPFDRLPEETLRSMKKKVFAHYFSQFPISIDDRDPANDYYQKGYLHPDGENGKHRAYGHFINQRPIPRLPRRVPNWSELDRYDEVRMAAETGMDGFAYNILSTQGRHWNTLLDLIKQVKKYGRGFSILIMPDMTAEFSGHPERMVPALLKIANDPSLFRIDGKLVIAPYNAYAQSPEWWKDRIAELKQNGVEVLFIPGFQGWWKYLKNYKDLNSVMSVAQIVGHFLLLFGAIVVISQDLGSALVYFFIFAVLLFMAGLKLYWFVIGLAAMAAAVPLLWTYFLSDYQRQRILTFLNPDADPLGAGYHILQSRIAIGSGQFWGKGFAQGTQSQLRFLPERHSDFAVAVFGEEWGFVGCLALVTLFAIFLFTILTTVIQAKDRFGSLLCVGVFFYFILEIAINMGMVVGLMPVVGIPLPFISYGGSATIVNFIFVGLVLNISMRRYAVRK